MAIFRITPATSVFTDVAGDNAFISDTAGADLLIVDPGAFLISVNANGAGLATTGGWTVTINGSIVSQTNSGVVLEAGNAAVSTITIGVDGEVQGGSAGMFVGSSAKINNAGTIDAEGIIGMAIEVANGGTHVITNSGTISGFIAIADIAGISNETVRNSGTINGTVDLSGGNDTVRNSNLIDGAVGLGDGTNTLTNTGAIFGATNAGIGDDTVANSGLLGIVFLGDGKNTLINSGKISADAGVSVSGGSGADTVTNSGLLRGRVLLGDGTNHLTNSGEISADANGVSVSGGSGADTVTNSGLLRGRVLLGDGTNHLTNSGTINGDFEGGSGADTVTDFAIIGDVVKSGTIDGTISLGDGDDTFTGGANIEDVQDGNGADIVALGGGRDFYIATGGSGGDGIDMVKGGAGIDTYNASAATAACNINLDSVAHAGAELVAANTATGPDISGANKDTIFGFENAKGGAGNDTIFGSAAGNFLSAGNGNDVLVGFSGNDTLDGVAGNDSLVGGPGKDQLLGGTGEDVFVYAALSDSGITAATRDLIADFEPGLDIIEVSLIDANKTNAAGTNDAFTFIGTNVPFTGTAGQLHAFWSASGQIIEGDINGDAKADFSIEISDPTHAITLASTDFNL